MGVNRLHVRNTNERRLLTDYLLGTLTSMGINRFCADYMLGTLTSVGVNRLRVKDINEAIKELGQMISSHTGTGQPMTRLMIVQEAVTVITTLEQQLRGGRGLGGGGPLWEGLGMVPARSRNDLEQPASVYYIYVYIRNASSSSSSEE